MCVCVYIEAKISFIRPHSAPVASRIGFAYRADPIYYSILQLDRFDWTIPRSRPSGKEINLPPPQVSLVDVFLSSILHCMTYLFEYICSYVQNRSGGGVLPAPSSSSGSNSPTPHSGDNEPKVVDLVADRRRAKALKVRIDDAY